MCASLAHLHLRSLPVRANIAVVLSRLLSCFFEHALLKWSSTTAQTRTTARLPAPALVRTERKRCMGLQGFVTLWSVWCVVHEYYQCQERKALDLPTKPGPEWCTMCCVFMHKVLQLTILKCGKNVTTNVSFDANPCDWVRTPSGPQHCKKMSLYGKQVKKTGTLPSFFFSSFPSVPSHVHIS